MLDTALLSSVAAQLMSGEFISVDGASVPVRLTSSQRLRTAAFTMNARRYQAIEQNPDKPSRWGKLAQAGHQVVQFKDVETDRFVAVAIDGQVREYGRGK